MNRFRFIFYYLSQHKYSYLFGIIAIVATNWIAVTIPEYLQLSIDLLSGEKQSLQENQGKILEYLTIMLLLAICAMVVRSLSRILFFNPGRAIEYKVKNDLFRKLTFLQKEYYDSNSTGAIISKVQNDISGVRLLCGFGLMQLFNIITALSLTPYKMWQLSPELTLYCFVPIVIVFSLVRFGMHFILKHTHSRMVQLQNLSGFIVSSLSGIDVIKSFNLSAWNRREFGKHNEGLMRESLSISFVRSFLMPILANLENILKVLILSVGGLYAIQGDFTLGELTAFIAYAALLTMPIMGLGWLTTMYQQGMVGIASLETILKQEVAKGDISPLPAPVTKQLFETGIQVNGLNFSYPGQEEKVLESLSFEILPGQTVGILGQVGAGKTTLVNCLNGYLSVPDGKITLGGKDLNQLAFSDIRAVVRTVSQDIFLFSDTVENNVIFGSPEGEPVTGESLKQVLFESALAKEVTRFPQQGQTMVGEKGIMLSGGQKQRISLARALMKPCDLLILDNVLSAVDYETERFLLDQILRRRTASSLLIVSHRVQALEKADLILIMEKGRVSDRGTHQELIERPGLYRETWTLQNQNHE